MRHRTYSELRRLDTFEARFDYLSLRGEVGRVTFGFDRWINQQFYNSHEWIHARDAVIVRDNGCDLGIEGHEIQSRLMVHHINPLSPQDLVDGEDWVINPEFLITVSHRTHNAIHYGSQAPMQRFVERRPGDTKLW